MGQRASAQYQTALARIAARNAAQQEALALLGGARGMYGQEDLNALGNLQGLYGNLYQGYMGSAAQEAQQKQAGMQMLGNILSTGAQVYGAGQARRGNFIKQGTTV